MKKFVKWAVVIMCFAWLLSLLGCGKTTDPIVRDKTGMVRKLSWKQFTVSQSSDVYEQNFGYTVKCAEGCCNLVLEGEYPDFEDRIIPLPQEAADALLAMDLCSFPDRTDSDGGEQMLDGTYQHLTVVDEAGVVMPKEISLAEFDKIIHILTPYLPAEG